jgi:ADP-heptose:LPS heptosyltransferase
MTNIGDVLLSCPVIDILRQGFPQAKIDVVVGPKAVSLFADNPNFGIKVFKKEASLRQKFVWFWDLAQAHYDCVVDLRRTALAFLLAPRYATPVLLGKSFTGHKKDGHLNRLRQVYDFDVLSPEKYAVLTTKEDERFFERELAPALQGKSFVVISPGAADSAKRWHEQGFAAVADYLSASTKVVFVGDAKDAEIVDDIQRRMKSSSVSLAGKTNLRQLAFVLKKCSWAMTHDSGVMHLASYLDVPLVALWGPTSIERYAPWGKKSVFVRRNEKCIRCQDPKKDIAHNCMSFIEVDDVINAISKIQQ